MTRAFAVLAAALAIAGCVRPPSDSASPAARNETAPDDAENGVITETTEGTLTASANTPARGLTSGDAPTLALLVNSTGAVIELEWSAATPASESLALFVRPSNPALQEDPVKWATPPDAIASAQGPSPLHIALPAAEIAGGDFDVLVRAAASPVGVAAEQPWTLHVTQFVDAPFDEAYTAIGAAP